MIGRVVFKSDLFGFIQNEEGVAYYFKPRLMDLGVPYESLEVGSAVHFNPKPRPRGLRAHSVRHQDKNKNPFYFELGALYVEKIGKSCRVYRFDKEPKCCRGRRLHTVMGMRSPAHVDSEVGFLAFLKTVRLAGANLVYDTQVSTSIKLLNGHRVTVYEWRAKVGIYVEPKKVVSQQGLDQVNDDTQQIIEARMSQLMALQKTIDLEHAVHAWRPEGSIVCPPTPVARPQIRLPEDSLGVC